MAAFTGQCQGSGWSAANIMSCNIASTAQSRDKRRSGLAAEGCLKSIYLRIAVPSPMHCVLINPSCWATSLTASFEHVCHCGRQLHAEPIPELPDRLFAEWRLKAGLVTASRLTRSRGHPSLLGSFRSRQVLRWRHKHSHISGGYSVLLARSALHCLIHGCLTSKR